MDVSMRNIIYIKRHRCRESEFVFGIKRSLVLLFCTKLCNTNSYACGDLFQPNTIINKNISIKVFKFYLNRMFIYNLFAKTYEPKCKLINFINKNFSDKNFVHLED